MGGATAASRDRAMAALIGREIEEASTRHTAPMIAEVVEERANEPPAGRRHYQDFVMG